MVSVEKYCKYCLTVVILWYRMYTKLNISIPVKGQSRGAICNSTGDESVHR